MPIDNNTIAINKHAPKAVVVPNTAGGIEALGKSNNRVEAILYNNGATTMFMGDEAVTTANGLPLVAGASATIAGQAVLHVIVAVGTEDLRVLENLKE